jgi:hypothetical protein
MYKGLHLLRLGLVGWEVRLDIILTKSIGVLRVFALFQQRALVSLRVLSKGLHLRVLVSVINFLI